MAVKLNRRGYQHARELVATGKIVRDERDAWSEHQPSTQKENEFIRCGIITAESRAGQYKHYDIEKAAAHLHELSDGRKDKAA